MSAIARGLVTLTPIERRIFDVLETADGWVETRELKRAVWGENVRWMTPNIVAVNLWRLRPKLLRSGWRVVRGPAGGEALWRLEHVA